jgi:hypothetical protein
MIDSKNLLFYTNVSEYNIHNETKGKIREKLTLPDFTNSEQEKYICALKPECPFESVTIAGLNFDKRVVSSDYSFVSNQAMGKLPKEKIIVRNLPTKLVDVIKKRATDLMVEIPTKQDDAGNYIPSYKVKVSDFLVLEPVDKKEPEKMDKKELEKQETETKEIEKERNKRSKQ